MKKIKCYVEICQCTQEGCTPTIWNTKPLKREIKNAKEFGYKIYPCEIIYNEKKELK